MKVFSAAAFAALALSASGASAADLPRRTEAIPPAPVYTAAPIFTWTGFYAGVNAGYGFGNFSAGGNALFGKAHGGVVGGTAGYNQQFGSVVLGVEGDWDWSGIKGSNTLPGPAFANAKLTNLATARIRAGYSIDRALLYVTGGYAGGGVRGALTDRSLPPGAQTFSSNNWNNGVAFGAGVEYAFAKNISAKVEYLRTDLSSKTIFAPPRITDTGVRENLLRAGVNYHF